MRYYSLILSLLTTMLSFAGCNLHQEKTPPTNYQTVATDPRRDTAEAQQCNLRAVQLIQVGKLDSAELELKAALAADVFFGPAHNNLGLVYFRQEKYYLAAWEFQYASKLMPQKTQPRNNLGMVFENVGKLDEAVRWYEAALEIEPDCIEVVANLARVYVRKNQKDSKTRDMLHEIVLKDSRPNWVEWARQRLTMIQKEDPTSLPTTPSPQDRTRKPLSELEPILEEADLE